MAYPTTIDTMQTVTSAQTLAQAVHSDRHNEVATTINAIQTELGINPSGGSATVVARFDSLDTLVASKAPSASPTFTGVQANAVGTAALPSITFTGDLDTGIYHPAANQVSISTNGVQALTVSSGGQVDIAGNLIAVGTVAGSGLAGSLLSSTTPSALGTAAAGSSTTPARADHVHSSSIASPTITGTATVSADVAVTGRLDVQEIRETIVDGTISANVLTADYATGSIFFIGTAPGANFTVNVTNAPTDNGKAITISVIVTQGATGYIPSVLQIGGVGQTIKWQYGSAPTPTSSAGKIDIFSFTLIRRSSAWTVLANVNANF